MKIINITKGVITVLAASSLLMGCSEDIYENSAFQPSLESLYLSVYPRDFEFGNGEETKTGSITSENAWSFTDIPSWLSLTPTSGNSDAEFSITSTDNSSVSNRQAVFYISSNSTSSKIQRTLTASQTGKSPYITFPEYDTSTVWVDGKSNYLFIDVSSNIPDLTATFNYDWATAFYDKEAKTVNIEIQANESNSIRTGTLTVSSVEYDKTAILTIKQNESGVTIQEGTYLNFEAEGGSQTLNITSDLSWTAKTSESWIEIYPKTGDDGENNLKITVLPNYSVSSRTGYVYICYGETEKKCISVYQKAISIGFHPYSITLAAEDKSSAQVEIYSNIGWELASCPEWLSLSPNKGSAGNTSLTVTAQKNNSLNSRSGTVKVKDSGSGSIERSLQVKQEGLDFGDQTTLEFGWQASTQQLTVPIPNKWNAAVSDGWITLSQYSGAGETTCDINVSRNDSPDMRSGQIVFTSEGKNITVSIVQQGQYITIDSTSGEVSAMGNTIELYVNTSVDVIPSVEYDGDTSDWVTYDKTSDNIYSISVKYNPSINQRSATFVLKPSDANVKDELIPGVRFKIKQYGRNLSVDSSLINIFSKGGTTDTYIVNAEGSYNIKKQEDYAWLTLVHDNATNTFYLVVTENKTDATREGNILVSLTELPEGEEKTVSIKVIQKTIYDSEINYKDYDDDQIL